ncbi:MAG TPA: hypothetical protein VNC40_03705 [Gaiellaceae bacterium]|nr:hypothetical protein [Gaiellaceae bacterium]
MVFSAIVDEATAESSVWGAALLPSHERELVAVFSPLAPAHLALGLETVYEAYLVHYGRPRLFAVPDADEAILLGDYLYAHGLVRVARAGGVAAVSVLAGLIARCAALRADGTGGDADAWVDATRALGGFPSDDEVRGALALHFARVALP